MYKLHKLRYVTRILRNNPSELLRLLRTGLTTLKYRYAKRCVAVPARVIRGIGKKASEATAPAAGVPKPGRVSWRGKGL